MSRTQPPVLKIVADGAGYRATSRECPGLSVYAPTYGLAEAEGNAMVLDFRSNPTAAAMRLVTSPAQITAPPVPVNRQTIPGPTGATDDERGPLTLAEATAQYFGTPEGADVPEHPDDIPADRPRRGRPPNPPKV
jgi:hypothetical protein